MTTTANPWGVSPAEAAALDAYIKSGSVKGAAKELGLSLKTIDNHLQRVRLRMGMLGNRLHYVLAWHDWRKAQGAA